VQLAQNSGLAQRLAALSRAVGNTNSYTMMSCAFVDLSRKLALAMSHYISLEKAPKESLTIF
jgi:hypothetical protein